MKKILILFFILIVSVFLYFNGKSSTIFAKGEVKIDPSLELSASGIGVLFITMFDEESLSPMPYATIRYYLNQDPKGTFQKFVLTKENMVIMDQSKKDLPKKFTLKARLDTENKGGADKHGDLVGRTKGIALGSRHVSILIDQKIN